jgi:hypothetical protein
MTIATIATVAMVIFATVKEQGGCPVFVLMIKFVS